MVPFLLLRCRGRRGLLVLLALGVRLVTGAAAQQLPDPIKYGEVDRRDLTAAPFAADSGAAAVVLCDFGRSRLQGKGDGFEVVFERVTRLKILKKAGYDAATVEISLYHDGERRERVSNLRGCTYNWAGGAVEKTKLEAGGAFLEKRTATVDVQKFTLPNVREGAVIEYAYTLRSDFLFNFQDWTFQRDIPTRWSEYRVSIPVFYKYKIIYQGNQEFAVNQAVVGSTSLRVDNRIPIGGGLSAGQNVGSLTISAPTEEHQWVLRDVPAFREEPYLSAATDYLARLDFQLVGEQWPNERYVDLTDSWSKINARLRRDDAFGQQLGRGSFLKAPMQALAARHPTLVARAAAVREFVMAGIRYDGRNRYACDGSLRTAYDAHRGTAADVNLLLIAALRHAGLAVEPVLLSTRDHGHVSQEYPLLDRFNYVVGLLPVPGGPDLLLDATEPLLPCGVLPERCLNQAGRLIPSTDQDEGRWVPLVATQRQVHYRQAALALDATGALSGTVHEEFGGYAGAAARSQLAAAGDKKYLAQLVQQHEGWAVPALAVANRDSVGKPLALNYAFSRPAADATPATTLYLSPLRELGTSANPFRAETRRFAVDLGVPEEETIMLTLTLPAGYELAETPKNAMLELPGGGARYVYSVSSTGGAVQLTSRLTLRKPVYGAEEYAGLRELYRLALSKQAEQFVIRRKG